VDVLYFQICGFLKRVPEQPYAILQILLDVGLISCFVCYPHHTRMYEIRYAFRFKFLIRLELFQSFLVLFFFFVFFFWSAIHHTNCKPFRWCTQDSNSWVKSNRNSVAQMLMWAFEHFTRQVLTEEAPVVGSVQKHLQMWSISGKRTTPETRVKATDGMEEDLCCTVKLHQHL